MKFLPLILANLFRKKLRMALTLCSFAVALFLFGLLATIQAAFNVGLEIAGVDRLVVRNKTSIIMPLPYSYRDRILQIPGVKDINFATWFGGVYKDERNFIPQFATDDDSQLSMFNEFTVPKEQWEAYVADREGCIVGRYLVEKYGFKVGDRIPIRGTIWPGTWEFNVRGVYDGKKDVADTTQFWFHYKYLEERREWGKGTVGWYMVKVDNPDNAARIAKAIDETFANSPYESASETERAWNAGFVKQMGNIQLLILVIGTVVFFTLLLVTGSTLAMSVRERTGELGVLKAFGFSDGRILALVLLESLFPAAVGGGTGIFLAKLFTLGGDPTNGMLPIFLLSWDKVFLGLMFAIAIGGATGILPALVAMRLRIVDALRRV